MRGEALRLSVGQGLRPPMVALLIGVDALLGTNRLPASQLFGVSPSRPARLGAVPLLLALVAAVACYLPARRASKLDPLVSLRQE